MKPKEIIYTCQVHLTRVNYDLVDKIIIINEVNE